MRRLTGTSPPSALVRERARTNALQVLAQWAYRTDPHLAPASRLEQSWEKWLTTLFAPWVSYPSPNGPQLVPFASHQVQFWDHVWSISLGVEPNPFIAVWPRGGAKSTSVEMAVAALAARRTRKYTLYICATQEQADDHVQNIGALLESPLFAQYYPSTSSRRLNKYGSSRGWRRNRLWTASGFTIDAIGLDTAARGVKLEDSRPDLLILDDIDEELDGPTQTEKKIKVLTTKLLPAGSPDSAVIAIQNLVIGDGVFARLANIQGISQPADFLQNRIVSGPFPAISNPQIIVDPTSHKYYLVGGTPVWQGQDLAKCQSQIEKWGYSSWLVEAQQEVDIPPGGLFAHIDFDAIHIDPNIIQLPEFVRTVVWVDPAVTSTDKSDSHGIQVDALGVDDKVYRLWSWEGRATPRTALNKALVAALRFHAEHVGVETDQGGDAWELAYKAVWDEMVAESAASFPLGRDTIRPPFTSEKAGAGFGPKSARASRMLVDYEQGNFRHVLNAESTHLVLERALRRFPVRKPYDLTDAAFWSWNDLKGGTPIGMGATDDPPLLNTSTLPLRYNSSPLTAPGTAASALTATPDFEKERQHATTGRLWRRNRDRPFFHTPKGV